MTGLGARFAAGTWHAPSSTVATPTAATNLVPSDVRREPIDRRVAAGSEPMTVTRDAAPRIRAHRERGRSLLMRSIYGCLRSALRDLRTSARRREVRAVPS